MNRGLVSLLLLVSVSLFSSPGIAAIRYVDGSVSQSGDGTSWESAFQSIQEGIDAASHGDAVVVAKGIYVENIKFNSKNIAIMSTDPLNADLVANTVIDGNQAASVVTFSGAESERCTLSGFTIRNGKADCGGGILGGDWNTRTRATIANNVIMRNSAYTGAGLSRCAGLTQDNRIVANGNDDPGEEGGGLGDCAGLIQNNLITGNLARFGGGLSRCGGIIRNNTIVRNSADMGGGLSECGGSIENNIITENVAAGGGGLSDCHAIIRGNTITMNTAVDGGGLQHCAAYDGTIENNIIAGNSARTGAGLHDCYRTIKNNTVCFNVAEVSAGAFHRCYADILNCIIWGNAAPGDPHLYDTSLPTYSCIQDWTGGGEGNTAQDPGFVCSDNGNFRLLADSPCIDAGFNDPDLPETDITGMHRIMFGGRSLTVDMGAYEFYINELTPGPGAGDATLTWSSIAGSTYVILYSEDLLIWILAEAGVPSAGNQTTSWIDDGMLTGVPPSLAPRRFYRVLENR